MWTSPGVTREALLLRIVAVNLRPSADAVPFQTAMQRGPAWAGDRRQQAVEAFVQRAQGMTPNGDDDRLFLKRCVWWGAAPWGAIRASAVAARVCATSALSWGYHGAVVGLTP